MKAFRASAEDIVGALLLPSPRTGRHDAAPELPRQRDDDSVVPTGLRDDVERKLAQLAGVEPSPADRDQADDLVPMPAVDRVAVEASPADFSHRLIRVAQVVAVGALVLIAVAAALSARFGGGVLRVDPVSFAAWGLGATICAITLASFTADPSIAASSAWRRDALGALLTGCLIVCVSGVLTAAGGVAGPAWVLFFPVVLVCGAVAGPVRGLAIGAAAAAGVYVSAFVSHTLTVAGVGRIVVILPAMPAAGWAAGALARLARHAAIAAAEQRAALERDVNRLSEVLETVALGDLSRVPAPGDAADPVATSLAVVFADTLLALRRLARQMDAVAEQLATNAADISSSAEQHVAGVDAQTAAVAETTSTVEQLAATAGSIAEVAVRVSQFAGSTRQDVDAGAAAVHAAGNAMDVIATRVDDLARRTEALQERIGRVGAATRLIDEISRRTTILAVNASIEAARAGDFGQGFANVATEVNTLAGRAREATAQIGEILTDLERQAADTAVASDEGLAAVQVGAALQADVVASLRRITAMVDRTTAAAREITEATRQQRFASDAVVTAMATVTTAGERYRSGSRGHAAAARRLNDLAEGLKVTLRRFKVV